MSRPEVAVRVPVEDLASDTAQWEGRKVRTVGFLTAVDAASSIGILTWEKHAIIVDLSLCMEGSICLPRVKSKIDCIGDVYHANEDIVGAARSLCAADEPVALTAASAADDAGEEMPSSDDEQLKWEPPVPRPAGPRPTKASLPISSVVLKCIYFRIADDLDVRLWNESARLLQSHNV